MTYAQARRWNGIAAALWLTGLAALGLATGFADWLFPPYGLSPIQDFVQLGALLMLLVAVQVPFDFIGGYWLPRRYLRKPPFWWAFILNWLRGFWAHGLIVGFFLIAWVWAARLAGPWAIAGVSAVGMLLLGLLQALVARWVANLPVTLGDLSLASLRLRSWGFKNPERLSFFAASDPTFTGGVTGWPLRLRLILPEGWFRRLPPVAGAAQLARLEVANKRHMLTHGYWLAFGWNLAGVLISIGLALYVFHRTAENIGTLSGVLELILLLTLWSGLGLLVLPRLGRPSVFVLDAAAKAQGVPPETLQEAIGLLEEWQEQTLDRPIAVEGFYPVPSVKLRLLALEKQKAKAQGAIAHPLQAALYLSWACGGAMSRATRTTLGRPEVWVFPPTD